MSSADALIAQLRAQRLGWVSLPAMPVAVRVQLDTPSLHRAGRLGRALQVGDVDLAGELVAPLLRAWEGVTSNLLLGAGLGTDEPAPASAELLLMVLADRPEWTSALASHAIQTAIAARARVEAASGN